MGAVGYADDVALLTPSPSALRLMLRHCENFAVSRGLIFNAAKTQPFHFGNQSSHSCSAIIHFSGVLLPFVDTIVHLGHYLSYNLSDSADILLKTRNLVRKANLMLIAFSAADPAVKSHLLQSYCLSLYGCSLWNISCSSPRSIEVSFNNILGTYHEIATRVFYISLPAYQVCTMFFSPDPHLFSLLLLITMPFSCRSHHSRDLAFTHTGYNSMFGLAHIKNYDHQEGICASVIWHLRLCGPHWNSDVNDMINVICTN